MAGGFVAETSRVSPMTVLNYCLVEEDQVLHQGDFDLESLEHFLGFVVTLSDSPSRAFSEKSSASNQTDWLLQCISSLQIAQQFFEAHSAPLVPILEDASSESPLSY